MTSTEWLLLKHLFVGLANVSALVGALLTAFSLGISVTKQVAIQKQLQECANSLQKSSIHEIPRMAVTWFLNRGRIASSIARWAIGSWLGSILFGGIAGVAWLLLPNAHFPNFVVYTASAAVVLMLVAHLLLRYDRTKRLALFFFLVYQPLNLATAFGFLLAVIDAIPHATNLKEYLLISIVVVPLSIVLSQISNDLGDTIHLLRFQRTRTTICTGSASIGKS